MTQLALALRGRAEKYLPAGTANFWCHVIEGVFASFGGEICAAGVLLPLLAGRVGASPATLGLLTSLGGLAFIAPLLIAPRLEAARRKKRLVLLLGVGQRLPLLIIAGLLLLLGLSSPLACLICIAAVNLMTGLVVSVLVPPWMDLLARTVPENRQGRLFGFRGGISSTMGLFAGGASAAILAMVAFPTNYATLYIAGFVSMAISWLIFSMVDEVPAEGAPLARPRTREYFRGLLAAMRSDFAYRKLLLYQSLSRLGGAVGPFYAYVALTRHGMSPAFVAGTFITASCAARIIGNFSLPFLSERIGNRRVLVLAVLAHVAAALVAALAPSGQWFAVVAFMGGLGMAAQTVSGMPFMMSVVPRGKMVGYKTIGMAAMAPVGIIAAPLAGILMQVAGGRALFAVAACVILCALLPLGRCRPKETQITEDSTGGENVRA
jgi:MFS family permease